MGFDFQGDREGRPGTQSSNTRRIGKKSRSPCRSGGQSFLFLWFPTFGFIQAKAAPYLQVAHDRIPAQNAYGTAISHYRQLIDIPASH